MIHRFEVSISMLLVNLFEILLLVKHNNNVYNKSITKARNIKIFRLLQIV